MPAERFHAILDLAAPPRTQFRFLFSRMDSRGVPGIDGGVLRPARAARMSLRRALNFSCDYNLHGCICVDSTTAHPGLTSISIAS